MLSLPLFRHSRDPDIDKITNALREVGLKKPKSSNTANTSANNVSSDVYGAEGDEHQSQQQMDEQAMMRAIEENQATDETLLDMSKLLLLAALYCKGSRIGKSNLLFPLMTHQ